MAAASYGVPEKDLFGPSSGRWLYNEARQRDARTTHFDVEALMDISRKSVNATRCVSFDKIAEGAANKVFLLRLDTDQEVIVRVASAGVIGNAHAVTASEVATMEYLQTFCGVKLPKVFAWSASPDNNPVGCEYIIMERLPGVPLRDRWYDIDSADVRHVLRDIADLEKETSISTFSQIGSLYYKEDVSVELQNRTLFSGAGNVEATERYRVGPSTNRLWWSGCRGAIGSHRGPWLDMTSCIRDAVSLTKRALRLKNTNGGLFCHGITLDHRLQLLEHCEAIAPYILPPPSSLHEPVLAHPDLNIGNILAANEGTPYIHGYIDWQAAEIKPRFLNSNVPPLFIYTGNLVHQPPGAFEPEFVGPQKYSELTPEEQDIVQLHLRLYRRQDAYTHRIERRDPHRRLMWRECPGLYGPLGGHAVNLVDNILYCTSGDGGAYQDLSDALHGIVEHWPVYMGADVPCPVSFSAAERAAHEERAQRMARYNQAKENARVKIGCDAEGWVPTAEYADARRRWEEVRGGWDEEMNGGPFPFQDGALVRSLG